SHCLSSFLLLLVPLPPTRSTLFPYTTLFRSFQLRCRVKDGAAIHPQREKDRVQMLDVTKKHIGARQQIRDPQREQKQQGKQEEGDRKSTRLNSSHVSNSYAVFCLKKKKTLDR